ncbi:hypothetical protein Q3G72_022878 [Acer saccharum]|nr:hypothetical protein Q3G72_022878 [Acer saccharum]
MAKNKVRLITKGSYIILDNGLVTVTISKPQGCVTGIKYGGMDNILDLKSSESSRGLSGDEYNVIHMSNDVLEVSFKKSFNPSDSRNKLPLSVVLRSGVSGFHCYSIYERPDGSKKAFDLAQTRMVFKLRRDRFHYMAITYEKQRIMPMPDDLFPDRGKQLIVPESVLLVNPINRDLKGEVGLGSARSWQTCAIESIAWSKMHISLYPSTTQNATLTTGGGEVPNHFANSSYATR